LSVIQSWVSVERKFKFRKKKDLLSSWEEPKFIEKCIRLKKKKKLMKTLRMKL